MQRAYLSIGRDVMRVHPSEWTREQWGQAREYLALRLIEHREMDQRMKD